MKWPEDPSSFGGPTGDFWFWLDHLRAARLPNSLIHEVDRRDAMLAPSDRPHRHLSTRFNQPRSRAVDLGKSSGAACVAGERASLLLRRRRGDLIKFLLQGFEVEARTLLERRELDESLGVSSHLLQHEDELPELEGPPVLRKE